MKDFLTLERIGLIISTIGSLLVAISVKEMPFTAYQKIKNKKIQMVGLWYPAFFRCGLILIISGFVYSLIATLIN